MSVIVSDASVLFDLADAAIRLNCFELPYEFQIADVMFEEELVSIGVTHEDLVAAGLVVARFNGDEVLEQIRLRARFPSLSAPDAFALLLARRESGILLTGDRRLRSAATSEGVERHGHLWLVERLSEHAIVANRTLVEVLKRWKHDVRVPLPDAAIDRTAAQLTR